MKKELREFSFECFSRLYNHEKPSSFISLDSLNKHQKTRNGTKPLLPRVSLNILQRTHPKDELTSTSICYPPQLCVKIKRYSPEMVGGNLGKGYVFVFILLAVSVSLEHDTPLFII
jgi:hypothetical protein